MAEHCGLTLEQWTDVVHNPAAFDALDLAVFRENLVEMLPRDSDMAKRLRAELLSEWLDRMGADRVASTSLAVAHGR